MNRESADLSLFDGLTPQLQDQLSEVLDRYFVALEKGQAPDQEQLVADNPELAEPLKAYIESIDFLQDAAAGFAPAGDGLSLAAGDRSTGQTIGDFELVREIGRGGMGVVYEARQVSLNRRVALKLLPFAALLESSQIARFRNEANAAARLHHPHIVPVFAVGTERGVHYYAMQLIDGPPLDEVIAEIRAAVESDGAAAADSLDDTIGSLVTAYSDSGQGYSRSIARLGIQAASALHAAHESGIVHRDIKPSNLLLDGQGTLWVTDFGLARCRSNTQLTRSGDFIGTIRYMSPEQARGKAGLVDHRSDIYSLGVTLYELLTLRHAVRGEEPPAILRQLDRERPYRPRMLNNRIPVELETIVLKAIAREPAQRYATAAELAEDLQRFLDGKPTIARRPGLVDHVSNWVGRHQRAVAGMLAGLLLAVVALAGGNWLLNRQKSQTAAALQKAEENYRRYRGQLAIAQSHVALLENEAGNRDRAEQALGDVARLQREILADAPGDDDTRAALADTLGNLGFVLMDRRPKEARRRFEEAVRLHEHLVKARPERLEFQVGLAGTLANLGSLHRRRQRYEQAVVVTQRAIHLYQEAVKRSGDSPVLRRDLAVALNTLATSHQGLDRPADAIAALRAALSALETTFDSDRQTAQDIHSRTVIRQNLDRLLAGTTDSGDGITRHASQQTHRSE